MAPRNRRPRRAARRPSSNHPSVSHSARRRTLALFDVENLLPDGPAEATTADYQHALAATAALVGLTCDDSAVLAVGSGNDTGLFACVGTWPGAAVRCRGGEDGADRALTEHVADLAAVARGYRRVVIGSGDHHFVACVRSLRTLGIRTTVVSRRSKLSRDLHRAADQVLLLPDPVDTVLAQRLAA